jgi:hypothetical protein
MSLVNLVLFAKNEPKGNFNSELNQNFSKLVQFYSKRNNLRRVNQHL